MVRFHRGRDTSDGRTMLGPLAAVDLTPGDPVAAIYVLHDLAPIDECWRTSSATDPTHVLPRRLPPRVSVSRPGAPDRAGVSDPHRPASVSSEAVFPGCYLPGTGPPPPRGRLSDETPAPAAGRLCRPLVPAAPTIAATRAPHHAQRDCRGPAGRSPHSVGPPRSCDRRALATGLPGPSHVPSEHRIVQVEADAVRLPVEALRPQRVPNLRRPAIRRSARDPPRH